MALTRAQLNMIKGKSYLLAKAAALTDYVDGQWIYVSGRTTAGDGYEGMFIFDSSNLSTEVAADTLQGIYFPPNADATGASGAWVRAYTSAINVVWFGAKTDGSDNQALLEAMCASYPDGRFLFPTGTYSLADDTDLPAGVTLEFERDAMLSIASSKTLTILSEIIAGNYQIFAGSGTIDINQANTVINICWYEGNTLNIKWDKAKAGFHSWRQKIILVPKPEPGAAYANEDTDTGWWQWTLTAPMTFTDECNAAIVYFEGELSCLTNIGSMIRFDDAAKPENIHFPLGVKLRADSVNLVTYGIEFRGGTRITFNGVVDINYAVIPVAIGNSSLTASISEIYFDSISSGHATGAGLRIQGTATYPVQDITILQHAPKYFDAASKNGVEIRGTVNSVKLPSTFYSTDLGNNAYAVIYIAATTDGSPKGIDIGHVYASNASYGVKTVDESGATAVLMDTISVRQMRINGATYAAYFEWLTKCQLHAGSIYAGIYIGSTCTYMQLLVGQSWNGTYTDNGSYTTINNMGKQAAGAATPPSTTVWELGQIVHNTSDDSVWIKIKDTGVSATDFLQIG